MFGGSGEFISIGVLNPSQHNYQVKKGTNLAICEPVSSVTTRLPCGDTRNTLPCYLIDLYERSTKVILVSSATGTESSGGVF